MENRMLNMACIMLLAMLLGFFILNAFMGLWQRSILLFFIFVCEVAVYYFARFKKKFATGLIINGLVSYIALIINYYFNSGINGPTLFLFFFTLHTLLSITPKKLHVLWFCLHVITVTVLLTIEFTQPTLIKYTYPGNNARMLDEVAVFITCLLFIFQVTRYLRGYYEEEKQLAEEYALKLKAFFDNSGSSHILLNRDFTILYFNNTAQQFLQDAYGRQMAAGKNVFEYVSPQYADTFRRNSMQALQGNTVQEERMLNYQQLGNIWWLFTFMPVIDNEGNVIGMSFNTTNITAAKEQELQLHEKNEALLKIAHMQKHELKQPALAVIALMKNISATGKNTDEYLTLMNDAVLKLDSKIYDIIAKTKTGVEKTVLQ